MRSTPPPAPARRLGRAAAATAMALAGTLALAGCGVGPLARASARSGAAPKVTVEVAGHRETLRASPPPFTLDMPAQTLLTPGGRKVDLRTTTAGKVALVYFGYTHCPDVCPETMANISAALDNVPVAVRVKVAVVFVTTDPDRDTGVVLWIWARRINPRIIALRGTLEQVRQTARMFGVDAGTPLREPGGSGYQLDHSATVTAFSPTGHALAIYPPSTQVADWVHDLPILTATATTPATTAANPS